MSQLCRFFVQTVSIMRLNARFYVISITIRRRYAMNKVEPDRMLTDYFIRQIKHVISVFLSTSDDQPDAVSSVHSVPNTPLNNYHRVM